MKVATAKNILVYLEYRYKGDWHKIYDHIRKKKPMLSEEELLEYFKKHKVNPDDFAIILDQHPEYPSILTQLPCPPFAINKHSLHYTRYRIISDMFADSQAEMKKEEGKDGNSNPTDSKTGT